MASRSMMMRAMLVIGLFWMAACSDPAPRVQAHFMPGGGAAQVLVRTLGGATKDVRVAIFAFTREEIRDALIEAHERGVRVRVKMDRRNAEFERSAWRQLKAAGIPVTFHTGAGSMHHKYCVIDGRTVLTGSYNWLDSAETKNHENLLVVQDATTAQAFEDDWARIPADETEPALADAE
jgi:phosphatidylserine/phosphatidylglycerophosphate/cardiolipin synthase-like enzyme